MQTPRSKGRAFHRKSDDTHRDALPVGRLGTAAPAGPGTESVNHWCVRGGTHPHPRRVADEGASHTPTRAHDQSCSVTRTHSALPPPRHRRIVIFCAARPRPPSDFVFRGLGVLSRARSLGGGIIKPTSGATGRSRGQIRRKPPMGPPLPSQEARSPHSFPTDCTA